MANGKAYLSSEQVERLRPLEHKLSKFTFTPRNIGYISTQDRELLASVYREVTNTIAPCSSCRAEWICKLNVWYQASKEKYEAEKTQSVDEAPKRGRKPSKK